MNTVVMIGRLCRDVELRTTAGGKTVANFTLAVDNKFNDQTLFIPVTVWERLAETCAKNIGKGRLVGVTGRLEQRSWEKDGQRHTVIEVTANSVDFLDWPKDRQEEPEVNPDEIQIDFSDEDDEPITF